MLPATTKEAEPSSSMEDQICRQFSLAEVQSATQNFDEALIVGRGGFGTVFKGQINHVTATIVAVKRLHSMSNQGASEFWAEVEMLSKLRHCNLVSLIGYCKEGKEMILVYDYMPHGTLEDHLHKAGVYLSWLQRLKICIGAARRLEYLHTGTGTQHGIIHRDVKSSNILLDEKFAAKVSDFSLAKIGPTNQTRTYVSTGVKGTFGYMDPGYFYTGKLTRKSDVYSFGVILLEVVCGRPAVDASLEEDQWGLATWAQDRVKEGKLNRIIDLRLSGQISNNCLKQFARLACRCLHNQPNQRPTMAETVAKLEAILSLQERSNSSDGNFINKLWSFFPGKVQLKNGKWMSANTASKEGEPSGQAVNMTVITGKSEVSSGSNYHNKLIHFDNSLFTFEDLLRASAEVVSKNTYWSEILVRMGIKEQLLVKRMTKKWSWNDDVVVGKFIDLGILRHRNLLALKAFYCNKEETLYIVDHIQNGSISSFLHPSEGQRPKLARWSTRLSIIAGITRGLAYLHTQNNTAHGHLTSKNVLLDENYNPLIADVGLSMLTDDSITTSLSNHAPELSKYQDANFKSDVYSLGLIMLELLTGKSNDSEEVGISLPAWLRSVPRKEWITEVVDLELLREALYIQQELITMLELATRCVSISPDARPNADQVLQQVEDIKVISEKKDV